MSLHDELIEARARIAALEARVTELAGELAAREASLRLAGELARLRGAMADELLERLESLQAARPR